VSSSPTLSLFLTEELIVEGVVTAFPLGNKPELDIVSDKRGKAFNEQQFCGKDASNMLQPAPVGLVKTGQRGG